MQFSMLSKQSLSIQISPIYVPNSHLLFNNEEKNKKINLNETFA